jgi:hypothetical protein
MDPRIVEFPSSTEVRKRAASNHSGLVAVTRRPAQFFARSGVPRASTIQIPQLTRSGDGVRAAYNNADYLEGLKKSRFVYLPRPPTSVPLLRIMERSLKVA